MKKIILISGLLMCLAAVSALAQVQRGFSFQGYARDFEGAALASQEITVQFSIYPQGGSNEFQEVQTVTTDPYGVFQLTIGATQLTNFSKLKFGTKNYWLKVETKANGGDFVEITNTQLLAVPYSQSAESALNGVPPGTILPFGGTNANIPAGFLACNGAQYNTSAYPDLFNAIEYAWGGSGTSFRVPDLRGYFLRGVSGDLGTNGDPGVNDRTATYSGGNTGNEVGSYQAEEFKAHNHNINDPGHRHGYSYEVHNDERSDDANDRDVVNRNRHTIDKDTDSATTGITIQNKGGNETRPKNAYVLYIIKF